MLIDCYVHIGLPRFQSVEDCRTVMGVAGIDKALACPFQTCPDLVEVHRALRMAPDSFRAAGIPLGADRGEAEKGVRAQLDAGFDGLRLSDEDVRDRPWLLDILGSASGFALVCGTEGLWGCAPALLRYLDRQPDALVLGGHFAGPTDPALFRRPEVAELFGHNRFAVICSRQSLFDPRLLAEWMPALVDLVGWTRLVWGSEAPVLHWRDESIADALSWVRRFEADPSRIEAFRSGNARRLIFDRPRRAVGELRLPFDPFRYEVPKPSPTWPHGLPLDNALTARLVHGWLGWGGAERGALRDYLASVLDTALPKVRR